MSNFRPDERAADHGRCTESVEDSLRLAETAQADRPETAPALRWTNR